MDTSFFWNDYLSKGGKARISVDGLRQCEQAFLQHKHNISHMIHSLSPASVAILGAGYLNDIPVNDLLDEKRSVYLVDWVDGVPKVGMSRSLLRKDDHENYHCLFCRMSTGKEYCSNFTGKFVEQGVCTAFEPVTDPFLTCKQYEPAMAPHFIKADVTAGVAHNFVVKFEKRLQSCKTAKDAFLKAIALTEKCRSEPLPVEDDSIELVTSSMVLSQFDFEPYTYFSTLLEKRFGREQLLQHESKLMPLMEKLRSRLFALQVKAHIEEVYRIVKKDGKARVYVSAELFRSYQHDTQYFLVQDMPNALQVIGDYFYFEFNGSVEGSVLSKSEIGNGCSINQCYRLIPKPDTSH